MASPKKQMNFSSNNSDFLNQSNLRDKNLVVKLPPSRGDIPGNFYKPFKPVANKPINKKGK